MLKNEKVVDSDINHIELELLRKQKQIEKATQREIVLREIMSSSITNFDEKEIIKSIVTEAGKLFEADRCFFVKQSISNDSTIKVEESAEYLSSKEIKPQSSRRTSKSDVEIFISTTNQNKISFVEDIENADLPEASRKMLVDDLSVKSFLIMPVVYGDNIYGALVFHYVKNHMHFTKEDIDMAQAIANQFAIVIRQAELYKAMQKQASREKFLRELISEISCSLNFNEIKKMLVSKLGSALNSDLNILYILDPITGKFFPVDEHSLFIASDDIKNPIGINVAEEYDWAKYILENKKTDIVYADIEELKRDYNLYDTRPEEFLNLYKIKSLIAIPIIHANTFLGFLAINFVKEPKVITEEDINLVRVVANQAGITLYQSKLYTQAQEASKAKSEFIATMSHELKTPLNIIIGFSDLLSKSKVEALNQIKYLQYINNSGKHLLNLINDILNIASIESGNFKLHYENFNLKELIINSVNSLNLISKNKNISIDMDLVERHILSDKKILTQILYNLLSNAIKFTPEGGNIKIKSEVENNKLIISIEDTGIGIDSEDLAVIFEKFKQIDGSLERKQQGVGLGLSITKKLTELLDGTIQVKSTKEKGSCFWLTLPKSKFEV